MRLVILMLLALAACTPGATARTWYVTADASGDAPTIQAGIDSAIAGDTVLVACGVYEEHSVAMKSGVCVRSETGDPSCVTVDAGGQGPVFICNAVDGAASLNGFTVTGGHDVRGGGAQCTASFLAFNDCVFSGNTANHDGAGVLCWTSSSPTFTSCVFSDNSILMAGGRGGGVFCMDHSSPEFTACTFHGNSARFSGGGLNCTSSSSPLLNDCILSGNSADTGGGVSCFYFSSPTIRGCLMYGNQAMFDGGALSIASSSPTIERCTLAGNSAPRGGCMYLWNSASVTLHKTIMAFCTEGEAFYCTGGCTPGSMTCCDVYGNAGGDWTDCVAAFYGIGGNISEDPLFCNALDGNFTLDCQSPCVEGYGCGQIGAYGVGCGASVAIPAAWGAIKSMYR